MGFSSEEHWSGLPCPPPGDLPNPQIKPTSPALWADSLPTEPPGKPLAVGRDHKSQPLLEARCIPHTEPLSLKPPSNQCVLGAAVAHLTGGEAGPHDVRELAQDRGQEVEEPAKSPTVQGLLT